MRRKNFARQLRANQTDAERRIWNHLRDRRLQGHKFRRQRPIGKYVVDFICSEAALIVEIDGGQHSDEQDLVRTKFLQSLGYQVLRFWNNDVLQNTEAVLQTIMDRLTPPHPTLSPVPGRGDKMENQE